MDRVHGAVWRIPVMQADHHSAGWSGIDSWCRSDWPLDQHLLVVPDGNDDKTPRPQFETHRAKGLRNIVIREEMRKRVVARDHDVVCTVEPLQIANVPGCESNVEAAADGFDASAVQSSFTDVGSVDLVPLAGEA